MSLIVKQEPKIHRLKDSLNLLAQTKVANHQGFCCHARGIQSGVKIGAPSACFFYLIFWTKLITQSVLQFDQSVLRGSGSHRDLVKPYCNWQSNLQLQPSLGEFVINI